MKAVVYSVPGTGTRFVMQALERVLGYKKTDTMQRFLALEDGPLFTQYHVQSYPDERLQWTKGMPYIVPLRNPVLSYLTQLHKAARVPRVGWLQITVERWRNLAAAVIECKPLFFPVDADATVQERMGLLCDLACHVQAPNLIDYDALRTMAKEWPHVGAQPDATPAYCEFMSTGQVSGCDLTPLDEAVVWYRDQVDEHFQVVENASRRVK